MKLGDFGLARIYEAQEGGVAGVSMSHQVATRQYRAPELLFASRHYTLAVDIWSVAVVMAELISLQVIVGGFYSYLFSYFLCDVGIAVDAISLSVISKCE